MSLDFYSFDSKCPTHILNSIHQLSLCLVIQLVYIEILQNILQVQKFRCLPKMNDSRRSSDTFFKLFINCLVIAFVVVLCESTHFPQTVNQNFGISKDLLGGHEYASILEQDVSTTTDPTSIVPNRTLDTMEDAPQPPVQPQPYWKMLRFFNRYFEYYENTTELRSLSTDSGKCSFYMSKERRDNISETNGIWAACQDPFLDQDFCLVNPSSPCNTYILYDSRMVFTPQVRTIKITFFLGGFATLRIYLGVASGRCFDLSRRKDMFSPCEFIQVKEEDTDNDDGWSRAVVSLFPQLSGTFGQFTLQLITRFQHDVVLIDRVEATDELLCEWSTPCPTPEPTTSPPIVTQSTTPTTTVSTTPEPIITDPDVPTTTVTSTTPKSSASLIRNNSLCILILYFFASVLSLSIPVD